MFGRQRPLACLQGSFVEGQLWLLLGGHTKPDLALGPGSQQRCWSRREEVL